jgi:hypothetical protein
MPSFAPGLAYVAPKLRYELSSAVTVLLERRRSSRCCWFNWRTFLFVRSSRLITSSNFPATASVRPRFPSARSFSVQWACTDSIAESKDCISKQIRSWSRMCCSRPSMSNRTTSALASDSAWPSESTNEIRRSKRSTSRFGSRFKGQARSSRW